MTWEREKELNRKEMWPGEHCKQVKRGITPITGLPRFDVIHPPPPNSGLVRMCSVRVPELVGPLSQLAWPLAFARKYLGSLIKDAPRVSHSV